MSSPISGLTRDTTNIIFELLGPVDWVKASKVCRAWRAFVNNTPWINEQLSYWKRLPKILQQNLPNRKLPVLHVSGEIFPPIEGIPQLRFEGEDWPTALICCVKPEMMSHPVMFVKDPLNRNGVALKYTYKISGEPKQERAIVLHEVARSGGKRSFSTAGQSGGLTAISDAFGLNWHANRFSQSYIRRLLSGDKTGLVKLSFDRSPEVVQKEIPPTEEAFIQLSKSLP